MEAEDRWGRNIVDRLRGGRCWLESSGCPAAQEAMAEPIEAALEVCGADDDEEGDPEGVWYSEDDDGIPDDDDDDDEEEEEGGGG